MPIARKPYESQILRCTRLPALAPLLTSGTRSENLRASCSWIRSQILGGMGGALCAAATGRLRRACVSHRTAVCVGSVLVLVFVQAAVVNGGQPVGSRQDSGTRWSLVTLSRSTPVASRNLALRPMRGGSDDSDSDSDSDSDKRGQKREDELSRRLNEQSLEPSLFDETPDAVWKTCQAQSMRLGSMSPRKLITSNICVFGAGGDR